jgi:glycosidase
LIQNAIWWIEYAGLAGLRVDTYGYSNSAFLTEWSRRIMAEYPNLNLVGEEWSTQIPVVAHWLKGKRNFDGYVSHMPSMMDFPLNDTLRKVLAGDEGYSLTSLYETVAQDHQYPDPANMTLFEGNHDMARTFSVLNHDDALFRIAMAYVLTMPRIPQLYYGTEIQMTSTTKGRDDPSYRQDFPGGWAGDKVNAFTGQGLTKQQLAAQAYLKKLLNWRKGQSVIHHGKLMHFGPENDTYVYFRHGGADGAGKVMVAINMNRKPMPLKTARFSEMLAGVAEGRDVVSGQRYRLQDEITLPARAALILELAPPDVARGTVRILDDIDSPQLGIAHLPAAQLCRAPRPALSRAVHARWPKPVRCEHRRLWRGMGHR